MSAARRFPFALPIWRAENRHKQLGKQLRHFVAARCFRAPFGPTPTSKNPDAAKDIA
jgi:hypothetical protein